MDKLLVNLVRLIKAAPTAKNNLVGLCFSSLGGNLKPPVAVVLVVQRTEHRTLSFPTPNTAIVLVFFFIASVCFFFSAFASEISFFNID